MSTTEVVDGNKKKRPRPTGNDSSKEVVVETTQTLTHYFVNANSDTRPCEKPFESPIGVELNFNYWIQNKYISDSCVNTLVVDMLGNNPSPSYLRKGQCNAEASAAKSVIVVAVHGCDPLELGLKLSSLPFLSTCTSMPIRHVAQLDDSNSTLAAEKKWQYMTGENMSSLLLWPERIALSYGDLVGRTFRSLFMTCSIVFQACV